MTQQQLRDFLLTRRETIAVIFEEWRREGMVSTTRGSIQVSDMERLRSTSCACDQRVASARQRLLHSWSRIFRRDRDSMLRERSAERR
ncbi:MAG: helix-turn-helix domain-containing protein, partial [Gammaproteobacteria bacterium]